MLALAAMYLLIHMTTVYLGFSLTRMDQTRSRRFFPLAATSGLLTAVLHYVIDNHARFPDSILEALVIGAGSGLILLLLAFFMLPRVLNKAVMVAAVVCFGDLIFSMLLLR